MTPRDSFFKSWLGKHAWRRGRYGWLVPIKILIVIGDVD